MKENGYIGGELLVNVRARQMIYARWTCNEKRNRKLEFNGKNFRWWSKRQAKRAALEGRTKAGPLLQITKEREVWHSMIAKDMALLGKVRSQ